MSRGLLCSVAALACLASFGAADTIDKRVHELMDAEHIPGLTLEIIRDGRVVKRAGYGFADLENRVRMEPESVIEFGSVTKQFVAAAIVMMQDRGQLDIDDPIGKYLPDLPAAWQPLTLRRILSHTAGLKDYVVSFPLSDPKQRSTSQLLEPMRNLPLDFEPGLGWAYSNTDYLLAGMVVESIAKKSLVEYLSENFFAKLGLKTIVSTKALMVVPRRAHSYIYDGKEFLNFPPTNSSVARGAGELMGSVEDLAQWGQTLNRPRQLSAKAVNLMSSPITFSNGFEGDYGFGQMVEWDRGHLIALHDGNTDGCSACLLRVPDSNISIAILSNGGGLDFVPLARWLLAQTDRDTDLARRKPAKDPDSALTEKLKKWLAVSGTGKVDRAILAPSFLVQFKTVRGLWFNGQFTEMGKLLRNLTYLDEDDRGSEPKRRERRIRYRAETDKSTVFLEFHWNPDDQIATLMPLYGEPKTAKPVAPKPGAPKPGDQPVPGAKPL